MTMHLSGWHPAEPGDDPALLRAELDACRAEIDRLRFVIAEARSALADPWGHAESPADRWGHADAPYEPVALEAIRILDERDVV